MENRKSSKSKNFINNPFFRLVAPVAFGVLIYFLVLLVFGTIDQIEINFFRGELILCLLISFLVSEINRLLIVILERKTLKETSLTRRIFIQATLSSLLIVLVTSIAVSFYMKQLVGFKSYSTELVVFNSLYIVLGWCLHVVYFSLEYLSKVTDIQYDNEKSIRKTIEVKMESSLNELKPQFLNKCLETLIVLSYRNPDEADDYLVKVSDFYRGKLSSKNELIKLNDEIETIINFLAIHSHWTEISVDYGNSLKNNGIEIRILHGSMRLVIEYILKSAIILPNVPLNLVFNIEGDSLKLSCKVSPKLNHENVPQSEIDSLNSSYSYYTDKKIELENVNGIFNAKIPLLFEE